MGMQPLRGRSVSDGPTGTERTVGPDLILTVVHRVGDWNLQERIGANRAESLEREDTTGSGMMGRSVKDGPLPRLHRRESRRVSMD